MLSHIGRRDWLTFLSRKVNKKLSLRGARQGDVAISFPSLEGRS